MNGRKHETRLGSGCADQGNARRWLRRESWLQGLKWLRRKAQRWKLPGGSVTVQHSIGMQRPYSLT